ncbi:MAG: hypothetical protein ABSH47_00465 [Bryobacteraceae bacterium]|jgi:hypothetical protein
MHATAWICALLSTAALFASERMNVSICNPGHLSESAVVRAEAQTAAVFHSMGIEIVWAKCGAGPASEEAAHQHWFTIRLRGDRPPETPGPASLELLGRAFVSAGRAGYLADVYYKAVQSLASRAQIDAEAVIGCVMVHELGHLLLGPGHVSDGIMRAAWTAKDMEAIRQRWLKFNCTENARIRRELQDAN